MESTRVIKVIWPASLGDVSLAFVLTATIAAGEAALWFGYARSAIWIYFLLLFGITLLPLYLERATSLLHAFALLPVFRLVNLTMPVFVDLTLLWLPLVYGPFIPVFAYLGWRTASHEPERSAATGDGDAIGTGLQDAALPATSQIGAGLPWWLGGAQGGKIRDIRRSIGQFLASPGDNLSRQQWLLYAGSRGLFLLVLPFAAVAVLASLIVLVVYIADIQYGLVTPAPLIPSLDVYQLSLLAVIMIGFVGFVEELLFRGVLQKQLEYRLGIPLGLLLASVIFGLMHSAYGTPIGIVFAAGVGLLYGILYDLTESLVLVSVMHGFINVLLFGLIPRTGVSATSMLHGVVETALRRTEVEWGTAVLSLVEAWPLAVIF